MSSDRRAVLVTGAGSGIGKHLAVRLAEASHTVYAGARSREDLQTLGEIPGVTPLQLDVTDPKQISAAIARVRESRTGLHGLVNNAGLGGLGQLQTWTESEFHQIFDVNVYGPWRMTNACLPLLLESHGRVVNIGSQGGMIAKSYYGPYTMTKHALEAYTSTLADELRPHGVGVSIVQPGGIATPIGENALPSTLARLERAKAPFREEAQQVAALFSQTSTDAAANDEPETESNRKPSSPEIVWTAVKHALFAPRPKLRYLVGTRWEGDRVLNALAEKLVQENDCPSHGLSRDELLELLDKHVSEHARGSSEE